MKFNALIPELSVSDIKKSLDFYVNILEFNIEYERKEEKFAEFVEVDKNNKIYPEGWNNEDTKSKSK